MSDGNKLVCDDCTLTKDALKQLKAKIAESLSVDRYYLISQFPFIGNLLLRLELIPVRDKRVMTACTDGKAVYFSIQFYQKLAKQERIFVLAHEMMHCVLMHLTRCQMRNQEVYNIATDMEVNYCLSQQGAGLRPPKDLCFPPKSMQGKSAEVIYEWLMRKFKKQSKLGQKLQFPNGTPNEDDNDSSDSSDEDGDERDEKNSLGQGENGSKNGKLSGQFDNHKFDDKDASSFNEDDDVKDEYGKVGYDSDFCPAIPKDFADKMREAVISEAQRSARMSGQGTVPAGIEAILGAMPKPKVDWKALLAQFCTTTVGDKRTWCPPNRRHIYNETYFQSRRAERLKLAVILDTSGSVYADLPQFFSELCSIVSTFSYEMHVIQCDAAVHSYDVYDNDTPFPVDDPKKFKVLGCGGSDFRPATKYLRDNAIEHDVVIFLTDGYITFDEFPPEKPAIVVLTENGNKECCSWGKKIIMEKDDQYEEAS